MESSLMYFFLWKVLEMIFYSQSGTFHTCQVFTASFCINLLPHIFFFCLHWTIPHSPLSKSGNMVWEWKKRQLNMLRRHAVWVYTPRISLSDIHKLKKKWVNMTDLCIYMKQKANGKCISCINLRSSVYDIIINSLYLCIKRRKLCLLSAL